MATGTGHELAEQAHAVATAAADAAGVRIGDLHSLEHLEAASRLFDTVWGRVGDAGTIVVPELLRAMEHAGCQVTGAFVDGRLVGATAALVGLDDGRPFLHSHVTGTLAEVRGRGVGWALKQYQRAWCLARGLTTVRWTFDPLIRRNAVFNLVKLGARPIAYLDDVYGPMRDALNAGLPTDRVVADWALTSARTVQAAEGRTAEPRLEGIRRAGAVEILRDDDGEPATADARAPRLLARIPEDVEALRVTDPDRAARWAEALRASFGAALRAGYRVQGITRDGWYVLVEPSGVEELA